MYTIDPCRILSPSHYEIKREATERKDSCTEDTRISFNGIVVKKSNTDASSKSSSKSMYPSFFICHAKMMFIQKRKKQQLSGVQPGSNPGVHR